MVPFGVLDKADIQPLEWDENEPLPVLGTIEDEDPEQVHSIPVESKITKLLSPSDIVKSDLAPYLHKAMMTKVRDKFIREHLSLSFK
jgi:hypothetical protein